MPAGALGVTLYFAWLSGASWPRSEGRAVGVSWGGRRRRQGEGVGCGQASGERAVRVRALAPLNARLGFGRPTVYDSRSGIERAGTSKRAFGVSTPAKSVSSLLVEGTTLYK